MKKVERGMYREVVFPTILFEFMSCWCLSSKSHVNGRKKIIVIDKNLQVEKKDFVLDVHLIRENRKMTISESQILCLFVLQTICIFFLKGQRGVY